MFFFLCVRVLFFLSILLPSYNVALSFHLIGASLVYRASSFLHVTVGGRRLFVCVLCFCQVKNAVQISGAAEQHKCSVFLATPEQKKNYVRSSSCMTPSRLTPSQASHKHCCAVRCRPLACRIDKSRQQPTHTPYIPDFFFFEHTRCRWPSWKAFRSTWLPWAATPCSSRQPRPS